MKKLILSGFTIAAFTIYAVLSRGGPATQATASTRPPSTVTSSASRQSSANTTAGTGGSKRGGPATRATASTGPPSTVTSSASRPSSVKTTAGTGGYKNGSYTGSQADLVYGTVQVKAVIQGGRLTDVQFLSQPTGRRQSQYINSQATPILKQEAIQAQSAHVQAVSGATLTSEAFVQSLQSALSQAKA